MRHILRRTSLLLVPFILVALVVGIPTAAPDTGLQNVTLSCSDGTDLGLTLSTTAVTDLTDATTAMTLFPADLSCGVSTQTDPPAGGNPNSDYAVGGGQEFAFPTTGPCRMNFGFNGNVGTGTSTGTPARGTFNETVPGGCAGFGNTGQLRVDITCVYVNGNHADMNGTVKTATGQFATEASDFALTRQAYISTTDNAPFPGDELRIKPTPDTPPGVGSPCGKVLSETPLVNGSISIHDATP
jgi:hypothetical protein